MNPFKLKSTQTAESMKENSRPGPAPGGSLQLSPLSNGALSVSSSGVSGWDCGGAKMSSINFRGGIIIPPPPPGMSLSPANQLPVQFPFQRARITPSQGAQVAASMTSSKEDADEAIIMDLIARETRTLMDNLHPGNFDELISKFKALPLEARKGRIISFITVVYDKAIERSSFSPIYARMLQTICKSSQDPEDIGKKFTKEIRKYYNRFIVATKTANVTKWKALNYVSFIEELYRAQLLTGKITVTCVHFALYSGVPNSQVLDSLCHLLRAIGQQLENEMEPTWRHKMLTRLELLMSKVEISETVRSTVLDLVQLWRNNWNPRSELHNGCGPLPNNFTSLNINSNGSESDAPTSSGSLTTTDIANRGNEEVPPDIGAPQTPTKQLRSKLRIKYDKATLFMIRDTCNIQEFNAAEHGFPDLAMESQVSSVQLPPQTEGTNPPDKTENEWRMTSPTSMTENDPKAEAVITKSIVRRARNMLNKLTLDSFSKLEPSFLALPLEHKDDRISSFIAVMFEKAVERPSSSSAYAKMLHTICKASSQMEETKTKFAMHIARQAHKEACESSQNKKEIKKLQKTMATTNLNENEVKECTQNLEERKRLNRERGIGVVTFIGELYKAEMLTPKIVMSRVNSLLNIADDVENFECICVLFSNVGHMLEMALSVEDNGPTFIPEPNWMDKIFRKLEDLLKTNLEAPELRNAIKGLVMLRKNGWKSQDHQSKISIGKVVSIPSTSGTDIPATSVSKKDILATPVPGTDISATLTSGKAISATSVSGKDISETPVPGNDISASPVPGKDISASPVPGKDISATPVPGKDISATPVPGKDISATQVAGKDISAPPVLGKAISATSVSGKDISATVPGNGSSETSVPGKGMFASSIIGMDVTEVSISDDKDKSATPITGKGMFAASIIGKDIPEASVTGKDMSATVPSVYDICTGASSPTSATSTLTLSSSEHKPKTTPAVSGLTICDKILDTEMKNAALTIQRLSEQGSGANLEKKLEVLKYIRELALTMESVTALKMGATHGSRHKNFYEQKHKN